MISADEPITEGINFEIDAQSDNADSQKLQEILAIAEERCPAMYSMLHVIKVNATDKITGTKNICEK